MSEEKQKPKYTILVTCAASIVVPSSLQAIERSTNNEYEFVGVDASEDDLAKTYLSHFYKVPFAYQSDYVDRLADIISTHKVNYLLVLSDEEALVLSEDTTKERLARLGCTVLLPDHTVVRTCKDKGDFLAFLSNQANLSETYNLVNNASDLDTAACAMGYPENQFIIKPRNGRGSRGIMLIDDNASPSDIVKVRDNKSYSLSFAKTLFESESNLDLIAMPYYSGEDYNIDVLCNRGEVVYSMIQRRVAPKMGAITSAQIVNDSDIHNVIAELVSTLNVTGLINIELARCEQSNVPKVYEINPRPSAAFAFFCYQGVDVLADLIAVLSGSGVDKRQFLPMKIKRVWQQIYNYE